jgi:DNA-binding Lrp family transcriptional regulator
MVTAFVLLTTVPGKEEVVRKMVKQKNETKECHVVYGAYDIHLTVETEDLGALDGFMHQLRLLEDVEHTMTLVAVGG